jgi:hypothetical protein
MQMQLTFSHGLVTLGKQHQFNVPMVVFVQLEQLRHIRRCVPMESMLKRHLFQRLVAAKTALQVLHVQAEQVYTANP